MFPCLEEHYVDKILAITEKKQLQTSQRILPSSAIKGSKRSGYIPIVQAAIAGNFAMIPVGQGSWQGVDRICNVLWNNPKEMLRLYQGTCK